MTSLYDDLGVGADASAEELRRAYRLLARQLHPDVTDEAQDHEQMRRLNRAWAVLGHPSTRQEYDRTMGQPSEPGPVRQSVPGVVLPVAEPPLPLRWLRPSVIAVVVLTIIFIATAYAGPHPRTGPGVTTTPTTVAGAAPFPTASTAVAVPSPSGRVDTSLIGECLAVLPGYDAVVSCSGRNDGLVVGQTARSADCGASTTVHQLAGRTLFVCLKGRTP